MTNDMYLSLAIELFEKGTWSKEVFIKRIILYAKEKNMNMADIDEIIDRLTKPKEYTIEEKRKFLSLVTIYSTIVQHRRFIARVNTRQYTAASALSGKSFSTTGIPKNPQLPNTKAIFIIRKLTFSLLFFLKR